MKFTKLIILLFSIFVVLNGCSTFGEAGKVLRNEKTKAGDEFLIKKNSPLTQPPGFEEMPEPKSIKGQSESEQNNIKKIIKTAQPESSKNKVKSSSTEKSILNQIKR
jgi:hypothetical protein